MMDGRILPQNGLLSINAPNGGTMDLDGLGESGEILLTQGDDLEIYGDLPDADPFTGTIEIGPGSALTRGDGLAIDGLVEMQGEGTALKPRKI